MDEIWFVETVESETDLRDDNCHHVQLSPCSQKEVRCERVEFRINETLSRTRIVLSMPPFCSQALSLVHTQPELRTE